MTDRNVMVLAGSVLGRDRVRVIPLVKGRRRAYNARIARQSKMPLENL